MFAILHCIVVGIENDRIASRLRIWSWRKEIVRNRKQVIAELNTSLLEIYNGVCCLCRHGGFPVDFIHFEDFPHWLNVGKTSILYRVLKRKAKIKKKALKAHCKKDK